MILLKSHYLCLTSSTRRPIPTTVAKESIFVGGTNRGEASMSLVCMWPFVECPILGQEMGNKARE